MYYLPTPNTHFRQFNAIRMPQNKQQSASLGTYCTCDQQKNHLLLTEYKLTEQCPWLLLVVVCSLHYSTNSPQETPVTSFKIYKLHSKVGSFIQTANDSFHTLLTPLRTTREPITPADKSTLRRYRLAETGID